MERLFMLLVLVIQPKVLWGQNTHLVLDQGQLIGLKVFPETSRTAVYSFLGIPYAQPPIGPLRFAYSRAHNGWNGTLFAKDLKPMCPQLSNSIYDETSERVINHLPIMDEDCLYLNVWVPEAGLRYGKLPVLVIITGEEMSFDWPQNRPTGLDLASEGIVVVTIQYRSNIFGWLSSNSNELPGNFGLHDQVLALNWIQTNIQHFGGNSKQVTLMGHGTSGVICGLIHLASPKSNELFSKIILMSGSIKLSEPIQQKTASEQIIQKLGCHFERGQQMVECLRTKSTNDLHKAFESVYAHGNYTQILGPVEDNFKNKKDQYFPRSLNEILLSGNFRKIPIVFGLCSNEGAFIRDYWIDLAREGFGSLKTYINYTIIPNILNQYFPKLIDKSQVIKALNWRFFDPYPRSPSYLLNSLQRLISEAKYEAPFYETIELIARALNSNNGTVVTNNLNNSLYVYSFQIPNSMDMRGKINLFGGSSHSSDLPLLLGPSLFQQIARRRFTLPEDKICRKFRLLVGDFIKTGNPTPGRIFDAWMTFTTDRKYIKVLGEISTDDRSNPTSFFEQNLSEIDEMLQKSAGSGMAVANQNHLNPYQLGSQMLQTDNSRKLKTSYNQMNQEDYEYYHHLKKVHSFWNVLLPSLVGQNASTINETSTERASRDVLLMEASSEAVKYKNAFISMLCLVCVLLSALGICVYLLKKHHPSLRGNL